MDKIQWKKIVHNVDEETGEQIPKDKINNYIKIKELTNVKTIQNGHGRVEITNQCRRVYRNDLFGNADQ